MEIGRVFIKVSHADEFELWQRTLSEDSWINVVKRGDGKWKTYLVCDFGILRRSILELDGDLRKKFSHVSKEMIQEMVARPIPYVEVE